MENFYIAVIAILATGLGTSFLWYIKLQNVRNSIEMRVKTLEDHWADYRLWRDRHDEDSRQTYDRFTNGVAKFTEIEVTLRTLIDTVREVKESITQVGSKLEFIKSQVDSHQHLIEQGKTK